MMGKPIWRNIGMQWSGAPLTTVPLLVCQACERHHDHPAIIFEEGLVVTQRELLGRAEAFAGYLQTRIGRGDRVAMIVGNRAEFMIAWLAVVAIVVSLKTQVRTAAAALTEYAFLASLRSVRE